MKNSNEFGYTGSSANFEEFLEAIGTKVPLRNFEGYTDGLDTSSNGKHGSYTYHMQGMKHEVICHISNLVTDEVRCSLYTLTRRKLSMNS